MGVEEENREEKDSVVVKEEYQNRPAQIDGGDLCGEEKVQQEKDAAAVPKSPKQDNLKRSVSNIAHLKEDLGKKRLRQKSSKNLLFTAGIGGGDSVDRANS